MAGLIVVDAHLKLDGTMTVEAGHEIAVAAHERVLQHHRVLTLMTHIDPFPRPDLEHMMVAQQRKRIGSAKPLGLQRLQAHQTCSPYSSANPEVIPVQVPKVK